VTTVKHRLFLHSKTTGLLAQFFRGIGLRKHGDPLVLDWNAVAGCRGYAKLGTRKYEGRDFQEIKSFIEPDDWPANPPQPVQQQQPQRPLQPQQPQQPQPVQPGTQFDPGQF
jgi:hypothetical protein